jgi:hypothetical protein
VRPEGGKMQWYSKQNRSVRCSTILFLYMERLQVTTLFRNNREVPIYALYRALPTEVAMEDVADC